MGGHRSAAVGGAEAFADLLRLAIAEAPIIVFAIDRDACFTLAEGRGWETTGYRPDELLGRSLFDVYGDVPVVVAKVRRALAGETVRHRYRHDGITFAVQCTPLRDEAGAIVGATGWRLDVSALAHAREQQALLARAVHQTSDGVLVTDAEGIVRYSNQAYEQLTGYAPEELLGRPLSILTSERTDLAVCRQVDQTIRAGESWEGPMVGRRKDATDYATQASVSAVRDAFGKVVGRVCVARDTTELDRLQRKLERSQRLEAIGRLAGGIAHDFNNLLSAILGYSEMCEADAEPGSLLAEGLAEIRQAAERGARLTAQMLAFSRKQPMRKEPIVLSELLRGLDGLLRRIIPETIELRVRSDDTGSFLGDPGQIEQVVLNLIVNAVDAMPRGGVLRLFGERVSVASDAAGEHPPLAPGDYAVLRVEDTGVGMSDSQLEHIFEPFYTTKKVSEGTGLGLAIVHGIVQRCGGQIDVTSQPDLGSVFRAYFPIAAAAGTPRAVEGRRRDGSAAPPETVLYVEDDPSVRAAVERMLRRLGYRVLVAEDAEAALELVRGPGGSIDLLLSDVVMPRCGGVQLARDVRRLEPATRVLFVSGYAAETLRPQLLNDPGIGFLAKPFQAGALDRALRDLLDTPRDAAGARGA